MKIKTLVRNPDDYLRETKHDIHKIHRNYDPSLHPFEVAREYTRALNAVKIDRVFAKPFICSLDGHRDAVSVLAKHPERISWLFSGSCDGELRIWDIASRKHLKAFQAHDGYVRGITFTVDGSAFYTIGDDKTVRRWKCGTPLAENMEEAESTNISKSVLMSITHHGRDAIYATSGETCQIWEETRAQPIRTFTWGVDSLHHVRFNPVETNILSACASDRSVILYDMRESKPLRKVVMKLKSNALAWNPMEAYTFTVANEDFYLYSFDMRNLNAPMNVHMDHTSAVTDLDYSPTGKEFVSGSYDKTVRIFEASKGHSRDIYHTKRMQRLTCVIWSNDDKYIMSGSDEMNIRLWKARASERLGVVRERERAALNAAERLKEKFGAHPQIKRIDRHRQIPKHVYNARAEMRAMLQSRSRKDANRRAHSKPGSVPYVAERKKHIIREEE